METAKKHHKCPNCTYEAIFPIYTCPKCGQKVRDYGPEEKETKS